MANLSRNGLRDELKKRGHSRYLDADLALYLGWALQDLYRELHYPTVADKVYSGTLAANAQSILLSTLPEATLATVGTIRHFGLELTGISAWGIRPAKDWEWELFIQPNIQLSGSSQEIKDQPRMYYLHADTIWVYPTADVAYDVRILWTEDQVNFVDDDDTSGLPERFDSLLILAAEVHCNRRGRDFEAMGVNQVMLQDLIIKENAKQNSRFWDQPMRGERYDHGRIGSY